MGFAAYGAELRCFAAKIFRAVENDRERVGTLCAAERGIVHGLP